MIGKTGSPVIRYAGELPSEFAMKKEKLEETLRELRDQLDLANGSDKQAIAARMEELKRGMEAERLAEKKASTASKMVIGAAIVTAGVLAVALNPLLAIPPIVVGMFGKIPFDVRRHKLNEGAQLKEISLHKLEFQQRWGGGNSSEISDLQKKVNDAEKELRKLSDSEREARQMLDAAESKEAEVIEDVDGPDNVLIIGDVKLKKKHILP